ncbi:Tim44 domain-containing protein [Brucella anthropi]|jgi:predicted lipid-binding transport protein (Tim44 family)|uniref:Tim44 domain-containing protein n=1 Tax=Brucella anthropi TaxID=529 RepID=UPI00124F600B|nr:Tim44 domain-containing protein [Brucella anthropi]KAB2751850.1 Tim44 domain-containing protein [Brucella anthropi]MDH0366348.1 Tim44 domain-containing protein [Brucella anthropi]
MPGSGSRLTKLTAAMVLGLIASFAAVDFAEARRAGGGGFGSRGARTYQAPAPTRTAPNNAAPMERSMTPNTGATQTNRPGATGTQNAAQAQRSGGMFGNFGRSMLGGLLVGGLIGMLLGNGLGGLAGMFGLLLQVAVIALIAMFVMRMFANRRQPAAAGAGNAGAQPFGAAKTAAPQAGSQAGFGGRTPSVNPFETKQAAAPVTPAAPAVEDEPMDVGQEDLDRFEQMLAEVQTAYGREDYAALRKLATPEAMSYLAEELGEIASSGMRNEVKDVKLLQGDVSEAWREGDVEYATVAIRYSAIDVMLDRNTGAVVEGNPDEPVESVELWTFTRTDGGEWLLAAIQGTE